MTGRSRAEREAAAGLRIARTYPEALAQISDRIAGWAEATPAVELLNLQEEDEEAGVLTAAELDRYERARDEVIRRLNAMGPKET
jgi:hypothetical protein